ncbi:hypothetical protein O3M35_002667 [Rhynocoris fuscipes]|uniref:Uncharacterized protein n=1 Tax=Rhynocoris fuscipes TaxID=488301 RepID=A0AAW1CQ71_9HEMI
MLSYMVPSVEEKPPPVPNKVGHLQLDLDNRETSQTVVATTPAENLTNGHPKRIIKTTSKSSTISGESSASSLSSVLGGEVAGTHNCQQQQQQQQDKSKHKVITNGPAKHPTLKR